MTSITRRFAQERLAARVEAFRVVVVNGPRQAGKTTLLRLFQKEHGGSFRSLDDALTLQAALADPGHFAGDGRRPHIIDEIQRGGDELVLAIKHAVDRDDQRGHFVLSGSTRFLTVPTLSESLAGRAVFLDLWPFAMAERVGAPGDFCDLLFAGTDAFAGAEASGWNRTGYLAMMLAGGYPEASAIDSPTLRGSWFDGYLSTVVLRDVASFADIRHGELIPRLMAMLTARAGSTIVISDLATGLGTSNATLQNYLTYLDTVFLIARVAPWSSNLTSRQVKTPKLYPTDAGLAGHLLQVDIDGLQRAGNPPTGVLVETFVHAELARLLAASDIGASVYFYRDHNKREVDFILERRNGQIVGIEVKATARVGADDFRHLTWLRDHVGDRFCGGYVLHLGEGTHRFGDRLAALPLSAMWHHRNGRG